jgi:tetrahydromethanopterin S-methyltransferase subunit B
MRNIKESILITILSLIFPLLLIFGMMSMFASQSLTFGESKQFDTIDEAVKWQNDMLAIASEYKTNKITSDISIQSPPMASYSITLKPLGTGFLPERREFNGQTTSDVAFFGFWVGMIIDGGFAFILYGAFIIHCLDI